MLVIFDCDGVLVDSEIISAQVSSDCLKEIGVELSAHYILETYRGKSVADCIRMITEELSQLDSWKNLSAEEQAERGAQFWRHVQLETLVACEKSLEPVAGIMDVLDSLQEKHIAFCVASNGKHEKMRMTLAKTGIMPYVQGRVFSFEDVTRGKPAPDLFLHAAKTLGVEPGNAIVVEDSLTGIQAAVAAGMRPLGYCPPNADGSDNCLLADMRALGAEIFFAMDELMPLILKSH
ncbi:HAD family phosphatase [Cellvibrio sp. pealriver]|uniref:HAD family hydrolase n=1 Tax=Cellvibrio sp. pealriver TaxID=1622269 RepID=UPI00066FE157|nr:HAD family phosphatase [Cellvibrio sp. pealriver]